MAKELNRTSENVARTALRDYLDREPIVYAIQVHETRTGLTRSYRLLVPYRGMIRDITLAVSLVTGRQFNSERRTINSEEYPMTFCLILAKRLAESLRMETVTLKTL